MDTVGAVCMDAHGHLCAGVSSGGVVYKTPGRIGQVSFCLSVYCTDSLGSAKTVLHFFSKHFIFVGFQNTQCGSPYMGYIGLRNLSSFGLILVTL